MQKSYPKLYENNPSEEEEIELFFKNFESGTGKHHRDLPHLNLDKTENKWKKLQDKLEKRSPDKRSQKDSNNPDSKRSSSHSKSPIKRSISKNLIDRQTSILRSKSNEVAGLFRKVNSEKLDYVNFVNNYDILKTKEDSLLDERSVRFSRRSDRKSSSKKLDLSYGKSSRKNLDLSYTAKSRKDSEPAEKKNKSLNKSFNLKKTYNMSVDEYKLQDLKKIAVNDMEIKALM